MNYHNENSGFFHYSTKLFRNRKNINTDIWARLIAEYGNYQRVTRASAATTTAMNTGALAAGEVVNSSVFTLQSSVSQHAQEIVSVFPPCASEANARVPILALQPAKSFSPQNPPQRSAPPVFCTDF